MIIMDDDKLLAMEDELVDDEDEKQIEQLALNSNFDPSLLDCWEEAAAVTTTNSSAANSLHDPDSKPPPSTTDSSSLNNVGTSSTNQCSADADVAWDEFDRAQQSLLSPPSAVAGNKPGDDPTLPPFETTATGTASAAPALGMLQQQQQQPTVPPPVAALQPHQLVNAPLPLAPNVAGTAPGAVPAFFPNMATGPMGNPAAMDLLPLAFNALAAGVDLSSFFTAAAAANNNAAAVATLPTAQAPVAAVATAAAPPTPNPLAVVGPAHQQHQPPPQQPQPLPQQQQQQLTTTTKRGATKKRASSTRRGKASAGTKQKQQKLVKEEEEEEEEPPFMLFDAPVELRHNFIQSQRAHGLPVLHDNNSYHFSRSSNAAGAMPGAMPTVPTFAHANQSAMPRLADARHGGEDVVGNKRIKNAKEQKRAQRITELIEQLRVRMEKGGWKVGIKSKLHTLSSCSDYVKHLVKLTKEKEAAVAQARSDLEAKRRKLEEDKSAQQDPSEPESTTSSLTVSSGLGSANKKSGGGSSGNQEQTSENTSGSDQKKPAAEPLEKVDTKHGADQTSEASDGGPDGKLKLSSHESNCEEYPSSVDNDDSGKKRRRTDGVAQHVSIGPISSVSDVTDNNKYSKGSSATSSSEDNTMSAPPASADVKSPPAKGDSVSVQNTVCSDAAVALTSDPKDPSHDSSVSRNHFENRNSEMTIQTITTTTSSHRKRKLQELSAGGQAPSHDSTSLESSFRLDYEEVFLKSNVPQIIASTTGRIVAHNDIFLRATSLHRSQVDRLTIFSLVQPAMLSNLFELVASSLREDDQQDRNSCKAATPLQDYSTMTLPCVPFYEGRPHLFMTITLMSDADVKKRCFHCIFTDLAPGVKGSVGSVTPQLLASLFKPGDDGNNEDTTRSSSGGTNSTSTSSDKKPSSSKETETTQNSAKEAPDSAG